MDLPGESQSEHLMDGCGTYSQSELSHLCSINNSSSIPDGSSVHYMDSGLTDASYPWCLIQLRPG